MRYFQSLRNILIYAFSLRKSVQFWHSQIARRCYSMHLSWQRPLQRCKFWQLNLAVLWLAPFFSLRSVVNLDFHFQDCDYYFEQSLKLCYKRNNTPPPPNELRVHFLSSFISPGLADDFSTLTIFVPRWLESGLKHVEQGVLLARNDLSEIKTELLNVLPQRSSKLGKISSGPLISLNHIGRKTKKTKKSKRTVNNLKIFKPTW